MLYIIKMNNVLFNIYLLILILGELYNVHDYQNQLTYIFDKKFFLSTTYKNNF